MFLSRIAKFIALLLLVWLPFAIPIYVFIDDRNLTSILSMAILYGEFILLVRWWGKRYYKEPHLLRRYGLEIGRRNGVEWLQGIAIALTSLATLFAVETLCGWVSWQPSRVALPMLILEGAIVAIAVGFAEELFFRGWLLDELRRNYSDRVSRRTNAIVFAALHFIKPLGEIVRTFPQFPGLILLGWMLVAAKERKGDRLGFPIGLHGGFVWGIYLLNVGELVEYSDRVPNWITGIDNNPLAGVAGIVFLFAIAGAIENLKIPRKSS